MPALSASAPGKVILFGEHSVVYGKPAIAVPVTQVRAKTIITADPLAPGGTIRLDAADIHLHALLHDLPENDPLRAAVESVFTALAVAQPPAMTIHISSTIPIASGLGSGAAVSVSLIRALSAFLGKPLSNEQVSQLAFHIEHIHHGTPSGIDNTVIAYNQALLFVRGQPMEFLKLKYPFTLLIGDTGIQSSTAKVVGDLRLRVQADPAAYNQIFDAMAEVALAGREALEAGHFDQAGSLMTRNHQLLQALKVSSIELDRLVTAALAAGALGAKLSGGGWGGNMIALVKESQAENVQAALIAAGATHIIKTVVGSPQAKV